MSSLHLFVHTLDAIAHPYHIIIRDSMRLNEANRLHWLGRSVFRNINMQFKYCEFSWGKVFNAGPNIDITNTFEYIMYELWKYIRNFYHAQVHAHKRANEKQTECAEQNKNFCHGKMAVWY